MSSVTTINGSDLTNLIRMIELLGFVESNESKILYLANSNLPINALCRNLVSVETGDYDLARARSQLIDMVRMADATVSRNTSAIRPDCADGSYLSYCDGRAQELRR
jgi:hypothetical protein